MSPPTYLLDPDVEKTEAAEVDGQIVQQFEISDPIAKACWFKDGTQIYPKSDADCESQKDSQTVPLQLHDLSGGGRFGCEISADAQFNVHLKGGVPHGTCTIQNQLFGDIYVKLSPSSLFSFWLCPNSRAVSLW